MSFSLKETNKYTMTKYSHKDTYNTLYIVYYKYYGE